MPYAFALCLLSSAFSLLHFPFCLCLVLLPYVATLRSQGGHDTNAVQQGMLWQQLPHVVLCRARIHPDG